MTEGCREERSIMATWKPTRLQGRGAPGLMGRTCQDLPSVAWEESTWPRRLSWTVSGLIGDVTLKSIS